MRTITKLRTQYSEARPEWLLEVYLTEMYQTVKLNDTATSNFILLIIQQLSFYIVAVAIMQSPLSIIYSCVNQPDSCTVRPSCIHHCMNAVHMLLCASLMIVMLLLLRCTSERVMCITYASSLSDNRISADRITAIAEALQDTSLRILE